MFSVQASYLVRDSTVNKFNFTRRRRLLAFLSVFGICLVLGLSASPVGIASAIGDGGKPLYVGTDYSSVPQSVVDDVVQITTQLFGEYKAEYSSFADDLLATYVKSADKDFVILFNPGGWGCCEPDSTSGWGSILDGIESQLTDFGNDSLILTYHRTVDNLQGHLGELREIRRDYSAKAEALALRVQFLTTHNPDLKVIIAGESMGTLICSEAMNILSDNPQVFSIQIGPPFWHQLDATGRTLVIDDNGIVPDSFSRGDVFTIMSANLADPAGKSQSEGGQGTILNHIRAPGHDYSWQYPNVSSRITQFFEETVGIDKEVFAVLERD